MARTANGDSQLPSSAWNQYVGAKSISVILCLAFLLEAISPGGTPGGRLTIAAFLALGSFLAGSTAELRADANGVRYRRFLRWHPLAYPDIQRAGRAWALGWLRTRRGSVIPFCLSNSVRLKDPLVAFIQARVATTPAGRAEAANRLGWLEPAAFAAAGAALILLASFLTPSDLFDLAVRGPVSLTSPAAAYITPAARTIFWGTTGAVLLALSARGRRRRLYGFLAGIALAWFIVAAPVAFR